MDGIFHPSAQQPFGAQRAACRSNDNQHVLPSGHCSEIPLFGAINKTARDRRSLSSSGRKSRSERFAKWNPKLSHFPVSEFARDERARSV